MFPLLRLIVKDKKTRLYIILLSLSLMLICDFQELIQPSIKYQPFYLLSIPMVYVITGYEIYKHKEKIKGDYHLTILCIVFAIVVQLLRWLMQTKLFQIDINNNFYCFWSSGFSFLFSMSVIIGLLSINIKGKNINKVVSFLGQRTFVIYLIHNFVFHFLESRGISNQKIFQFLGLNFNIDTMSTFEEITYILVRIALVFGISLIIATLLYLIKIGLTKIYNKCTQITLHKKIET